jgi:Uncharacterized protein involved in exopolysaccharide biosynthesis
MTDKDKNVEKEIDLVELGQTIWKKRRFIIKISIIGFVIGVIVAFSIPKEYTTSVILAPEAKPSGPMGNMGALAAMAGVNLQQSSQDAISPDLYPDILSSTPFIIGLFDVKVIDERRGINTTLYEYLDKHQKGPWWGYIFAIPSKIMGLFSSSSDKIKKEINREDVKLTHKDYSVLNSIKNRIHVSVDKKGVITLSSTMQSPDISAFIADTVTSYLQEYIIKYRTHKARQDLVFSEKLYQEAKADYYKAQQEYTTYSDKNLDIVSARYGATKERLQNEVTLAYNVYNQMAQQLQMAKVKVQDTTPVYTIIQPPVIPIIPEKPNKKLIVLGFIFIAFLGSCVWIIMKDYLNLSFKK